METRQFLRPLSSVAHASSSSTSSPIILRAASRTITNPFTYPTSSTTTTIHGRRHQSTTSRTKKMLKLPPHPDFITPQSGKDHIIFNPPAAAPSVYHTPFKFLPKTDPRRQANVSHLLRQSADPAVAGSPLPPQVPAHEMKYNVTQEQVEEMRQLRAEDPRKWSVLALAKRYDCSPYFVMMCCKADADHKKSELERLDAIKARWGTIRTKARVERQKRKKMLLRGEL
ncbi:mitochondrial ribosomal protein subunit L20-domain-containing protein [Poronia punctata]|nr:mitochondrial ribosomal protein subunit L20-domain-containing protein [Poronia punctata]